MRGDQLARQWLLIQRLARNRTGCALDDLADELECVRRTVYRDLNALLYAGFPLTSEKRDGRVYYRFLDSFKLGDVPFTSDEILALAFGEDLLRALEGTVFHDSIHSALKKIRSSLSPELADFLARMGDAFRVLPGPHKNYARSRDTIQRLNDAVIGRRRLRMRYYTGHSGQHSQRDFDPYRVWYRSGGLYVLGHDHRSDEVRVFAVERIESLEATGERFDVPVDFDFDRFIAGAFGVILGSPHRVRLRFDPSWEAYISGFEWHPSQKLTRAADGRSELELEVAHTADLRAWLLSFGAGVEVLEPEELRESLRAELQRALARHSGNLSTGAAKRTVAARRKKSARAPRRRPR